VTGARARASLGHARFTDLSQRLLAQLRFPCGDVPEPGDIKNVAPGIYWLRMPLPFQLNHINLWLVEEKDGWTDRRHRHQHRRHARAVGEDLRRAARRQAGDARRRHASPSRPYRPRRLAVRALERAALMTLGEYMSAVAARNDFIENEDLRAAHLRATACRPTRSPCSTATRAATPRAWRRCRRPSSA
jgi:hypothetical protein